MVSPGRAWLLASGRSALIVPLDCCRRSACNQGRLGVAAEAHAGQSMIGSADTLRHSLRAYEATNVDILALTVQSGDRRQVDIMESLELLGREVFAEFKERQAEHDRWREQQLDGLGAELCVNSTV